MEDNQRDRVRKRAAIVRQILLSVWDPIGVAGILEASDEYDSYVWSVCKLLDAHQDRRKLVDYLILVETTDMGLSGQRQRAERVADLLIRTE
jgi:hypothetical protein